MMIVTEILPFVFTALAGICLVSAIIYMMRNWNVTSCTPTILCLMGSVFYLLFLASAAQHMDNITRVKYFSLVINPILMTVMTYHQYKENLRNDENIANFRKENIMNNAK